MALKRARTWDNCTDDEPSFSKQQLGASSVRGECKLLGLKRDKVDDTLHVSLPSQPVTLTKRGILANSARMPRLVKVYDPLRLVSPEGRGNKSTEKPVRWSWAEISHFPRGLQKGGLEGKIMHRMMCTFLAVLFSTMNRTTALNYLHLVMQVITVCVLLCILWLHKCQVWHRVWLPPNPALPGKVWRFLVGSSC